MAQIVTASRLADGAVVFRDAAGGWTERLDRAAVLDKADVAAALEAGKAAEDASLVVDVYAVDVSLSSGATVPLKLREAIRARGPTILPALAKPGSAPAPVKEDDHVSV
jgi:sulfite reductase (NADPH) hemoprotein beta-component